MININKLRELAISIIEDVEQHIEKSKKPFDDEEYYEIEDNVYTTLYEYLVGEEDPAEIEIKKR